MLLNHMNDQPSYAIHASYCEWKYFMNEYLPTDKIQNTLFMNIFYYITYCLNVILACVIDKNGTSPPSLRFMTHAIFSSHNMPYVM